jgi:hypothetical protein
MNEWAIWLPVLVSLFIAGANCAIFAVIKFNDMKHMEEATKRIEKCASDIAKDVKLQGERIAKIEGKCIANHG